MKKILGLILTLCMLCLLPSYMGKADIDEIYNKITKEGYATLTNDEIDEYCSHSYPNLPGDSGFGVNSEKISEKDRAWITKVYREALKSKIKAYRKYDKTFVKLSEKNKSNKGELYWYSEFMDTVPFIGDSLYLDNYLIGGDSKTINDIVDNTTYKIRDGGGSTVNVYKSKKIYLQDDEIWLEKGDTSWYVIGILPQEDGYLKGSRYYLKFNNKWSDDLNLKRTEDEYGMGSDWAYSIVVRRPNDYVWKKTFSLKYAPSYENFEEEFRQKVEISGSCDTEIKQSSDSAYVYYTVIFPEISDRDVWYGIDAFESALGKYYRKYPRNKYPRKNKLLDMLVNHSDGSNCDYKRIEIRYAYSRKTREAKEITFTEHDLWYHP